MTKYWWETALEKKQPAPPSTPEPLPEWLQELQPYLNDVYEDIYKAQTSQGRELKATAGEIEGVMGGKSTLSPMLELSTVDEYFKKQLQEDEGIVKAEGSMLSWQKASELTGQTVDINKLIRDKGLSAVGLLEEAGIKNAWDLMGEPESFPTIEGWATLAQRKGLEGYQATAVLDKWAENHNIQPLTGALTPKGEERKEQVLSSLSPELRDWYSEQETLSNEQNTAWNAEYQKQLAKELEKYPKGWMSDHHEIFTKFRIIKQIYPEDHPVYQQAKEKQRIATTPLKEVKQPEVKLNIYNVETTRGTVQIVAENEKVVRDKAIKEYRADFADVKNPVTKTGEITLKGNKSSFEDWLGRQETRPEFQAGDVIFKTEEGWATIPSEMYKEATTSAAYTFTLNTDKGTKTFIAVDEEQAKREAESYGLKVSGVESKEEITLDQKQMQEILTTSQQKGGQHYLEALVKTGVISPKLSPYITKDGQIDIVGALQDSSITEDDLLTVVSQETLDDVKAQIEAQKQAQIAKWVARLKQAQQEITQNITEGIEVMPDYSVVSGNQTIGKIDPETGYFIASKPSILEILEAMWHPTKGLMTQALLYGLNQLWKSIPFNPYWWLAPREKMLADYKELLIKWASGLGIENPQEWVNDLMAEKTGELTISSVTEEELEASLRPPTLPSSSAYATSWSAQGYTRGEQFIAEWVAPALLLALLPTAGVVRAALEPTVQAGGVIGKAAQAVKAILKPIELVEQATASVPSKLVQKIMSTQWTKAQQAAWAQIETTSQKFVLQNLDDVLRIHPNLQARATPQVLSQIAGAADDIVRQSLRWEQTMTYGLTGLPEAAISEYTKRTLPSFIRWSLEFASPTKTDAAVGVLRGIGYTTEAISRMSIDTAWNNIVTRLGIQGAINALINIYEPEVTPIIPQEMPTEIPPVPPEATTLGRTGNEYTGFLVDLQDAEVVADIAFRNDVIRRWANNLPGLKGLAGVLNPSVVADKPATKAIVIRATLRDEGYQKTQGVIASLNQIGAQEKIFGQSSPEGLIKTGSLEGHTLGDIAQSRARWESKLTSIQRQWLDQANEIENAVTEFLKRNDIDINLLRLEEGGQFATRKVWAKTLDDGTVLDVAYVGAGPGRPGAKLGTEKHRVFKTEAEAIAEGYRYIPYEEALYLKVQGAYNRVADKKMADWLLNRVPWRTTGAPEELKVAAYAASQKKRHSQMLLAALNRAARGERVPAQTINAIARYYPDQAEQLKNIITRIQAKEKASPEVRNLRNVAKGLIETDTMMSLRATNARARAREAALQVRFGEAMVPAPAFAGKILTGPEAKETAKVLRETFEPGFSKALGQVNKANAIARYFMLAGDFSPFTIQLLFLMGSNPVIYNKAFGGAIKAMLDSKFQAKFLAKHKATIDRHPNLLISKGGATEFTEAMARGGWLSGKTSFRPQAEKYWKSLALFLPRVMSKVGATTLTPFQRVFEQALDSAGIYMAEAYDYLCTTPENTFDVDQFINEFRGLTSSARIGVSPRQRQAETTAILAPRYNRAIAGLLLDLWRGNIRGSLARKSLIKGIAALVALAVAISIARGENKDEILEHFNPNSSNFFTWDIGGQKVGPGSKIRSLIKLWAQSASNPESLLQLSMDNPALRFLRGNLSPVMGSGIDLITGRNYIGDPTRDGMLSFSKEILAGNLLPIWLQTVLLEGGDLLGRTTRGLAEFFGGRGYPEPLWNEVGKLRDKYAQQDFNVKYEELNRQQIDELKDNHPDLKELELKAELENVARGSERDQFFYDLKQQAVQERNNSLEELATQLLAGQISKEQYDKERGYIRPYYSGEQSVLWQAREFFDPYGVRQINQWMDENLSPEDKALDEYLEYRANLIQKADLPKDWDKISTQCEDYLSSLPKATRDYVENNLNRWINDLPENARKIEEVRAQGVETGEWWNDYGETEVIPKMLSPEEAAKKIAVRKVIENWSDILDTYNNIDTDLRLDYRMNNPQTDAILFLAGKVSTLRTGEARLALVQLMQKNNIRPEDVYGANSELASRLLTKIEGTSLLSNKVLAATELYESGKVDLSEQPTIDAITCWVEVKTTNHGFPETQEGWGKLEDLMAEANVDYNFVYGEDIAKYIDKIKIYHTKIFDEEDGEFKSLTLTEKKALSYIDPGFEQLGIELWGWTPIDRAGLSVYTEAQYRTIARNKGWEIEENVGYSQETEKYWWEKATSQVGG